ncbi:T9SS type A sorting domain-containing protein [Bacteroidota bacterium]
MRNVLTTTGLNIQPGVWWLDFQAQGSLSSVPWAPPITINGQATTGNAVQRTTGWGALQDGGSLTQQGVPFIIYGSKVSTQGMEDITAQKLMKVYSNPATSYVNIQSNEIIRKISIYNQVGQLVYSQTSSNKKVQVNTDHLDFGVYAISIQTDTRIITQKLLIK